MPPPRRDDRRNDASPRRGFQPITVPLGPRGDGKAAPPAGFETGKKHETEPEPIPEPEPELDEDDLEKKREEKRRRREAIMAKFRTGEGAKPPLPTGLSPGGTEPASGADSMNGSTGFPTGVNSETGEYKLCFVFG
jgi:serine/threonine-protein kinase PRP4